MSERTAWDDFLAGKITKETTDIARGTLAIVEKQTLPDWKKIYKELYNDEAFKRDHLPILLEINKLTNPNFSLGEQARAAIEREAWQAYQDYLKQKKNLPVSVTAPATTA